MAEYCLPKKEAAAFLNAIKSGTIAPEKLMGMSSSERRKLFGDTVGEDHAEHVNALFESKMLLKDQQRGMVTWAKKVSGISDSRRADIIGRIEKLDRVLNPAEEKAFLSDLAKQKLGISVTSDEAKNIFTMAKDVAAKKTAMEGTVAGSDERMAYGYAVNSFGDYVDSLKPDTRSKADWAKNVLNLPASALTFLHLSAGIVHAWGMVGTKRWWEGMANMFSYMASEGSYQGLRAYIVSHPDYQFAVKGRLGLTELGAKLSAREEAIQSSLLEEMNKYVSDKTGLPNLVRGSSRAYVGYLNYVRFNRFTDLLQAARMNGEDVSLSSSVVRDIAKVVNDFTGRGDLDLKSVATGIAPERERFAGSQAMLNATFFSPRKLSGTMSMFNPVRYLNPAISPTARTAAAKQLTGSLIATGAVVGLAAAMGASVTVDPRSADFMKIRIGDSKLDITGGNAIYLRLLARLASNESISSKGKLTELGERYGATTRADLLLQFARGKLSPIAGVLADALYGKDPVGRPFSVTQESSDKLVPIFMSNYINFLKNDPHNTAMMIPALSSFFGVGLESPIPNVHASERDVWGEKWANHDENSPVDKALAHVGMVPREADKIIRGVKLNDAQYDEHQQRTGRMSKAALSRVVSTSGFNQLPIGRQADMLEKNLRQARENARTVMLAKHPDIVPVANQAKQLRIMEGTPAQKKRREATKP